jgi:DNA-binding transcriptional MerR regulator
MTSTRTIQRAAAETGLSADTLRYYERIGILPGIARSQNGHRQFSDDDMGWIKLVQCLRSTGMPMEDLHTYAELMQQGDATAPERLRLLEAHRRRIRDDLAELSTALELVERKISGYEGMLAHGLSVEPPEHRPAPRKVRVRAPGDPGGRRDSARSSPAVTRG